MGTVQLAVRMRGIGIVFLLLVSKGCCAPLEETSCTDMDAGCADYLRLGDNSCSVRGGWMREQCAASCGICRLYKRLGLRRPAGSKSQDSSVQSVHSDQSLAITKRSITGRAFVLTTGGGSYAAKINDTAWQHIYRHSDVFSMACDTFSVQHADIIVLVSPWADIELELCLAADMEAQRKAKGPSSNSAPLILLGHSKGDDDTAVRYERVACWLTTSHRIMLVPCCR